MIFYFNDITFYTVTNYDNPIGLNVSKSGGKNKEFKYI
jgi:hypothetical protein